MRILLSIFFIFSAASQARGEYSLGLSLPQGFELAYRHHFADHPWSMRIGLGGWPIERAWPGSLGTSTNFNDYYACDIAPRAFMTTSSVKAVYQASPDSTWIWSTGLEFWMIQGGALAFLRNRDNGASTLIADIQSRWWQPLATVSASWTFARSEKSRWELELSLALLLAGGLRAETQGPLPALKDVAPEYSDAVEDGTTSAEQNLSESIHDVLHKLPVLPSLGVRYSW